MSPFSGVPYACFIWDHGSNWTIDDRATFAEAIIKSGCIYVACHGETCELWHDVIDEVSIMEKLYEPDEVDDELQIMTTWHTDDSPEEVTNYFVAHTKLSNHKARRFSVLHMGNSEFKLSLMRPLQPAPLPRYYIG